MCGIMAAIAKRDVVSLLLDGLKRLEYRGYDSAGLALWNKAAGIQRVRAVGKVDRLIAAVKAKSVAGHIGIAHTRWATHGKPTEKNAHPHMSDNQLVLVHNGIIENYAKLRDELSQQGIQFDSETDTEVIAHLLRHENKNDPIQTILKVTKQLHGNYALVILFKDHPTQLFAVRSGSPLVIGIGEAEHFVSSDSLSLLPLTNQFIYLEEGDIAEISLNQVKIVDRTGKPVTRAVKKSTCTADVVTKGDYPHYMLKEIHEQPQAIANILKNSFTHAGAVHVDGLGKQAAAILKSVRQVKIVACGTSYHAGIAAKYWLESWLKIPCDVEIASEFRYRDVAVLAHTLFITLSQSGETADTLAALRVAKQRGYIASLCICNVPDSSLVRESDLVFLTTAGPEVGVASTKAFTAQLTALYLLVMLLGQLNQWLDKPLLKKLREAVQAVPDIVRCVLDLDQAVQNMAKYIVKQQSCLFLGRGQDVPIAMEGALKLKEISYIHAESYPAGELKHGPLALIDDGFPVIVVAPENNLFDKLQANIQEVKARGGKVYVLSDTNKDLAVDFHIQLPHVPQTVAPIVYVVPLQLLAYHVGVMKGTDVDQPRNLAKSVTVE